MGFAGLVKVVRMGIIKQHKMVWSCNLDYIPLNCGCKMELPKVVMKIIISIFY